MSNGAVWAKVLRRMASVSLIGKAQRVQRDCKNTSSSLCASARSQHYLFSLSRLLELALC